MGRDFTPRELHEADVRYCFSKRKSIGHTANGETVVLYDPDDRTTGKWPNLNFLLGNSYIKQIAEAAENSPGGKDVVERFEKTLSNIIQSSTPSEENHEWTDTVKKWYEGQLDPDFYYSERNNEMFTEFIVKCIGEN